MIHMIHMIFMIRMIVIRSLLISTWFTPMLLVAAALFKLVPTVTGHHNTSSKEHRLSDLRYVSRILWTTNGCPAQLTALREWLHIIGHGCHER